MDSYRFDGPVAYMMVVLPDCRGLKTATTGYSLAASRSSLVGSRRTVKGKRKEDCENIKYNFKYSQPDEAFGACFLLNLTPLKDKDRIAGASL
jgi:hypothetical protein